MGKHILKVNTRWDIDSTKDGVAIAIGADHARAANLAMDSKKKKKISESIEEIMFNNNETIQTRILAIYLSGRLSALAPLSFTMMMAIAEKRKEKEGLL